jgi:hypothetical protein
MNRPAWGAWAMGGSMEEPAEAFMRVWNNLTLMHQQHELTEVIYEKPILGAYATFELRFALIGLAAHVDSWCLTHHVEARACATGRWRKHFIGITRRPKSGDKTLKDFAMEKCDELGLEYQYHDTAEAHGILDYRIAQHRVVPPWRLEKPMTRSMG